MRNNMLSVNGAGEMTAALTLNLESGCRCNWIRDASTAPVLRYFYNPGAILPPT